MGFTPTDMGEYVLSLAARQNGAGTTAGTAVNGYSIDRRAQGSPYKSCQVVVPFSYTKGAATTIAVNGHLQDSPEGSTWTDFGSTVAADGSGVTAVGATTAATTGVGTYRRNVDLTTAKRYVRVRITPQITVVSTVNALNYSGQLLLGGGDQYPATS